MDRPSALNLLSWAAKLLVLLLLLYFGAAAGIFFFGLPFLAAFIAVLSLAAAVFGVTTGYSVLFGAPFVPTDIRNVEEMIRVSGLKPGEYLVDLGSGDGRILIAAARAGARAEGWEISPFLWLWSLWRINRAGVGGKVRAHLGSYWNERFDRADVVTLFLINTQMKRMEKKLRAELPAGSRVVSYAFKFPTWKPVLRTDGGISLYRQEPGDIRQANLSKSLDKM